MQFNRPLQIMCAWCSACAIFRMLSDQLAARSMKCPNRAKRTESRWSYSIIEVVSRRQSVQGRASFAGCMKGDDGVAEEPGTLSIIKYQESISQSLRSTEFIDICALKLVCVIWLLSSHIWSFGSNK